MRPDSGEAKQVLLITGCLVAIVVAGLSIYFTQFSKPAFNLPLHQGIAQVMADETARLLTNKGKIVVIAIETDRHPELQAQLREFESRLKQYPELKLKETYKLETEGRGKYGVGSGLSARRYTRLVNKNLNADALVSFVGVPELKGDDLKEMKRLPRLVAETKSTEHLRDLFAKKVLHVAIVPRFEFPAPFKGHPRSPQEWFENRFQVVTETNVADLPEKKRE